jgi:hypothetical protein
VCILNTDIRSVDLISSRAYLVLHYPTLHYTTLHCPALHHTTPHYTTPFNTTPSLLPLGMDDSSPEVRNLLTALMDKAIPADEQGLDRAGDREISMALFGISSSISSPQFTLLCDVMYNSILFSPPLYALLFYILLVLLFF